MEMTRETMVAKLVDNFLEKVFTDKEIYNDTSYLAYVFEEEGFKPFNKYTNEELEAEYNEIFEADVRVAENEYYCDNCGGGFVIDEMVFDVNDNDLCKGCNSSIEHSNFMKHGK